MNSSIIIDHDCLGVMLENLQRLAVSNVIDESDLVISACESLFRTGAPKFGVFGTEIDLYQTGMKYFNRTIFAMCKKIP